MTFRTLLIPPLFVLSTPLAGADEADPNLELAREHVQNFYAGELDGLWDAFTDEMKKALGSKAGFAMFQAQTGAQLGEESEVLNESLVNVGAFRDYLRTVSFEQFEGPLHVRLVLREDDRIAGFSISPQQEPAPSEYAGYDTRTALRLPFDGEWLVFWGGRGVEQNYHAAAPDQRFAYDFVVVRDGRSHEGTGERNEDYHCFGLPIQAPGDGVVALAVDGEPDQPPGHMDPGAGAGNHVIIDHGNDEFSFLAHLKQGSITVEAGQTVEAGDVIGACGNSGHTSEPHLHYHLQRDAVFHAGAGGEGLPAQFLNYLADGERVERGEPVRGQVIQAVE